MHLDHYGFPSASCALSPFPEGVYNSDGISWKSPWISNPLCLQGDAVWQFFKKMLGWEESSCSQSHI